MLLYIVPAMFQVYKTHQVQKLRRSYDMVQREIVKEFRVKVIQELYKGPEQKQEYVKL